MNKLIYAGFGFDHFHGVIMMCLIFVSGDNPEQMPVAVSGGFSGNDHLDRFDFSKIFDFPAGFGNQAFFTDDFCGLYGENEDTAEYEREYGDTDEQPFFHTKSLLWRIFVDRINFILP